MNNKLKTLATALLLWPTLMYASTPAHVVSTALSAKALNSPPDEVQQEIPKSGNLSMEMPEVSLSQEPFKAQVDKTTTSIDLNTKSIRGDRNLNLKIEGSPILSTTPLHQKKYGQLRGAANLTPGAYIAKDVINGSVDVSSMSIILRDNQYYISGIYNLGDTIPMNVDLSNGTVSINSQKLFTNSTYGDVYIYPIMYNADGSVTYSDSPIYGSIDANGVITLPSWGLIPRGGTYDNRLILGVESSVWTPSNARINVTKNDGSRSTWPLLVEQTSSSQATIYNFASSGAPVKMRLDANKNVTISPQYIMSITLYGDFYCYPVTITENSASVSQIDPITGSGTDNTITLQPWLIGAQNQPTLSALFTISSTITTDFLIQYPQKVDPTFEGSGTATSPYLIKTASQLVALSQSVNGGNSYNGKYIALDADIDMTALSSDFLPIGTQSTPFQGNFDGRNHTISNLTVDGVAYLYQGMFGAVYGTISNLTLSSPTLTGSGYYFGAVAGWSSGKIINCHVKNGNVNTAAHWVGGIVGRAYAPVEECSTSGVVKGYGYIGGVIGQSFHEITKCTSSAYVAVDGYLTAQYVVIGGIAGLAQSYSIAYESKVTECYFTGKVSQNVAYGAAGGLVGFLYASDMHNCFNVGSVAATISSGVTEFTGGLVGNIRDTKMTNCYNAGTISSAGQSVGTGGLIGYLNCVYTSAGSEHLIDNNTVTNCYNSGAVLALYRTVHSGVYGTEFTSEMFPGLCPSATAFNNTLSDNQATGLYDNTFGKTTDYFTGATLPTGFEPTIWNAGNGLYPTLKAITANEATALSSAAIHFASGQSVEVMKSNATLQAPSNVKWSLLSGTLTTTTDGLRLSGSTLSLAGAYANDTLVAYTSTNELTRYYVINAVPTKFQGEGTASSPYLINNVADFIQLDNAVQHYNHRGDYFLLTADVDFNYSDEFAGVGSGNHLRDFAGTFDGNSHTISKLKIKSYYPNSAGQALVGSYNYGGLFHILSETATIKNVNIAADCNFDFYNFSGAIAGEVSGIIENCRNYAPVQGVGSIGGIVGMVTESGTVSNCYNAGAIKASSRYAGGITGYSLGTVSNSQNDAPVNNTANFSGGIVGASGGGIYTSVNSGTIAAADYSGGIVGSNVAGYGRGDVAKCVSSGIVQVTNANGEYIGALIGWSNGRGDISDNFYDRSINTMAGCSNLSAGFTGLFSTEMINGPLPEVLSADTWTWGSALYPSLKLFANEEASKAIRSIYIDFGKDQVRSNVIKNVSLSANASIQWKLAKAANFSIDGTTLKISVPEAAMAIDTLYSSIPGKCEKIYILKSAPVILDGNGTMESPYLIRTVEDLDTLASFIAVSKMDYDGYYFRVENDINFPSDFAAKTISPSAVSFNGIFDGAGHTISGYNIENNASATGKYLGFISTLGARGVIRNLTLAGHLYGYNYSGAFAGKLYGTIENCVHSGSIETKSTYCAGFVGTAYDGSRIINCVNKGKVQPEIAQSYAAGIVARLEAGARVDSCSNQGEVGNYTVNGTYQGIQYVAGIANWSAGRITNSFNSGAIKSRGYAAGIVSASQLKDSIINCYNTADIIVNGSYVAGIIATTGTTAGANMGYLSNCYNTGKITGSGYVGGIGGNVATAHYIENCYNTADITCNATTNGPCGGAFGYLAGTDEVYNCWNSGNVVSNMNNCGGFGGRVNNTITQDCHNTGNVTVHLQKFSSNSSGVGGFAGSACGTMNRIWNSGNVISNVPGCAGISGVGAMPIAKLNNVVNLGDITCDTVITNMTGSNNYFYYIGGIWGGYGPCQITNSYNAGTLTGPSNIGGINGAMCFNANGGCVIENCYNAGKIIATDSIYGCSNIATYSPLGVEKPELYNVKNAYFDSTINPIYAADSIAIPLTSNNLLSAPLGDGFIYQTACYPTLAFLSDNPIANIKAAYVLFTGDDNPKSVTDKFILGTPGNVTWTVSDNLSLEGNTVTPKSKGKGWIKASSDGYEKTIEIVVTNAGQGIDGNYDVPQATAITVYDLSGMPVANPIHGNIYIVRILYSDGTMKVEKTTWINK